MYKVLGINDDVTTCECCGRSNLKATVVLESADGSMVHFGKDCAARVMTGDNKSSAVKSIESLARCIAYARRWLNHTPAHTAAVVANAIRVRFCGCSVVGDSLSFPNGILVS